MKDERRKNGFIELERFEPVDTPRYVPRGTDGAWAGPQVPRPPVPEKPLHLCPTCDYNLTGLTSRRCPECGEPFTLGDARHRAIEKSPGMRSFYRAEKLDRFGGVIGLVLLAVAVALPNFAFSSTSPWVQIQSSYRSWIVVAFIMLLMLLALVGLSYLDATWSRMLLTMGVLAALVSVLITIF
ncbi:MAG: hypothetical protein JXQ75_16700 [Phycisphaerae bacterium]|nr:hypothetical protein [Phycisphaerae bacterium]